MTWKDKLNIATRGKVIIPNKLVFAGGEPKFTWLPGIVRWGACLSLFWLGCELVWIRLKRRSHQ